ncbi:hypothetical protein EDB19DRAFT_541989 [Suillus lakei]|nr:hypothetical protein EDB19DRAFT_541989 [Suillus lakei]
MHATLRCTIPNILPMSTTDTTGSPDWCRLPKNAFYRVFFKALCMIAVSKPSVEHWEELGQKSEEPKWDKHKKMVINRFQNMNVTAGLVLTTSAVFISTTPPNQTLIPYASHGSYILQVSSFIAALISLMTGTSVLIIYDNCYAHKGILEAFKRSRRRLIFCLILMAFPSLALAVSTLALMPSL